MPSFFFNDTATTEIYTLSLHDALPIYPDDPVATDRAVEPATPSLARGAAGLRIAIAGGYFRKSLFPEAQTAVARVAAALGAKREIELDPKRTRLNSTHTLKSYALFFF